MSQPGGRVQLPAVVRGFPQEFLIKQKLTERTEKPDDNRMVDNLTKPGIDFDFEEFTIFPPGLLSFPLLA